MGSISEETAVLLQHRLVSWVMLPFHASVLRCEKLLSPHPAWSSEDWKPATPAALKRLQVSFCFYKIPLCFL